MEKITFFFEKKKGEKEREEEEMKALKEGERKNSPFFGRLSSLSLFLSFSAFSPRLQLTSPLKRKKQIRWFSSVVEHWSCKPGVPRSNLGISFVFFFFEAKWCACVGGWVCGGGGERRKRLTFSLHHVVTFFILLAVAPSAITLVTALLLALPPSHQDPRRRRLERCHDGRG